MRTLTTFEAVREQRKGSVALVPTMGFLHEGHVSLIEAATACCDTVVVSVFVNPLQFGDAVDLDAYPVDLKRDTELAARAGADIVFAPRVDEMYPDGPTVRVTVSDVGDAMEGSFRPGHFDGVATVVAKLFAGIQPDVAFFGRKDAQQLALVTTMADVLAMPVKIVGCPIVRESDGLALSSRNTRLGDDRADAVDLSRALICAADLFTAGERRGKALTLAVRACLATSPSIDLEYVEVADAATADVIDEVQDMSFLALAATVGGVRLIDNVMLDGRSGVVDIGERIDAQSILYGGDPCS